MAERLSPEIAKDLKLPLLPARRHDVVAKSIGLMGIAVKQVAAPSSLDNSHQGFTAVVPTASPTSLHFVQGAIEEHLRTPRLGRRDLVMAAEYAEWLHLTPYADDAVGGASHVVAYGTPRIRRVLIPIKNEEIK